MFKGHIPLTSSIRMAVTPDEVKRKQLSICELRTANEEPNNINQDETDISAL